MTTLSYLDPKLLRMLDANLNRAREGLRVVEDCARFVLDDRALSTQCKSIRHRLRAAVDELGLPDNALIGARDTTHDVGTSITADGEQHRPDGMRDLVAAACKRATEALRVIEESAKALGRSGSAFESIRYTLYTIEQRVMLALRPPCPQWTLCVLVTRSLCTHHDPIEVVKRAAAGGADCIQIREKGMTDAAFFEYAARMMDIAEELGLHVIINDRPDIAMLVEADGVHLGQDDLPIQAARALMGPRFWIGRSCSTLAHAHEAIAQGADICGLGPVFASTTKTKPDLAGLGLIGAYLNDVETRAVPMLAISGIDERNIDYLAGIGCRGVAVSSAICSDRDPESIARAIVTALTRRERGAGPSIGT